VNRLMRHPQIQEFIVQVDQEMDGEAELVSLGVPRSDEPRSDEPRSDDNTPSSLSVRRLSRRGCRDDCRCKCHARTSYRWPEALRAIVGDTFLNFVGQPAFVRRCSRRDCRKAKIWSGEITYVFPSWLLKKIISMSMISKGPGWSFHMKCVNIVRSISDVARYTTGGDLAGLRMLFSNRLATPYDTESDGWTLLHVSCPNSKAAVNNCPNISRLQHITGISISLSFCGSKELTVKLLS
jgi:hypothetical protein